MNKILLTFLFLLSFFDLAFTQNQNSNWCFGFNAGIHFDSLNNPATFTSAVNSRGSCASISDSTGNLLFYVANDTIALYHDSACKVYNANHQIMQNGDGLIGLGWYQEFVIVPYPDALNLYYVFQIGITENYGLYYSTIDMSQNGGLGAVMLKNVQLDTLIADDCLTAVKHGNGRDWWLFFRDNSFFPILYSNIFYTYLITPSGISNRITNSAGPITARQNGGVIKFNNLGNQFIYLSNIGQIDLFDFDRCSGTITHNYSIEAQSINPPWHHYFGCEFSSTGKYLYVANYDTISRLYQFDLLSPNITTSKILIDSFIYPENCGGQLKLASDNKIYMSNAYNDGINFNYPYPDTTYNIYNMNLSVINQPDSPGLACNFTKYSFYLGGNRTYWGLPNNPDYALGPLVGSVCDTLTGIPPPDASGPSSREGCVLYPNPAFDKLNIESDFLFDDADICIYNLLGEKCFTSKTKNATTKMTLDVSALKQGLYLFQLNTGGKVWSKKFFKE